MGKRATQSVIIQNSPVQINMWDRLPGETDKPWDMFVLFRETRPGERRLVDVSRMFGCNPVYVTRTARKYGWHQRVEAWDRHLDNLKQVEFQEETKLMARRQAKLAMKMQDVAQTRIDQIAGSAAEMASLTAGDVRGLAKDGVEIERKARGEQDNVGDERTIIVNFGTMIAAPKWAPQSVKDQFPQLPARTAGAVDSGKVIDASRSEVEEGTTRAAAGRDRLRRA